MNEGNKVFIIVAAICISVYYLTKTALTKIYTDKIIKAMSEDEASFNALLESKIIGLLFKQINIEFIRLNYYVAHKMEKKIDAQLNIIQETRCSINQKLAAYQTVFQYYAATCNKSKAHDLNNKIVHFVKDNKCDTDVIYQNEVDMKIYFENDMSALNDIDNIIKTASEENKKSWYIKKAFLYKKNGFDDLAKECLEQVSGQEAMRGLK